MLVSSLFLPNLNLNSIKRHFVQFDHQLHQDVYPNAFQEFLISANCSCIDNIFFEQPAQILQLTEKQAKTSKSILDVTPDKKWAKFIKSAMKIKNNGQFSGYWAFWSKIFDDRCSKQAVCWAIFVQHFLKFVEHNNMLERQEFRIWTVNFRKNPKVKRTLWGTVWGSPDVITPVTSLTGIIDNFAVL